MTCTGQLECTCGCCAGIAVQTPQGEDNRPGLPMIAYRTGSWATFKNSMLARLSSADYPALAGLKTRDDDDFSIALLDASAMMLDVLTFYQERLANESYLRTATQLSSLTELARLIGYQPSPGVAASTYLAFTVRAAPGAPNDPTAAATTIPAGTKVQSVPAQGQTPQTFETSRDILAKADWNALPVQTGAPWKPERGQRSVYLAGTSTQLNPGDAILIVGDERASPPHTSEHWDVRIVSSVEPDGANGRTRVIWSEGLGHGGVGPAQLNPRFYALRQRSSLFGYNAVNPLLLAPRTLKALTDAQQIAGNPPDWRFNVDTVVDPNFTDSPLPSLSAEGVLDLDGVYGKLNPGGWIVLISPDQSLARSPSGFVKLYGITSVTTISRSAFGVSAKISRLGLDSNQDLIAFTWGTRTSSALVQSEALTVAEQPLDHPLYGAQVDLEIVRNDLAGVTAVAVSGKRQRLAVKTGIVNLVFTPDDGAPKAALVPGDTVALTQPPKLLRPDGSVPNWRGQGAARLLAVADSNDRTGTVLASLDDFTLATSAASDPTVQEFALVSSVATINSPFPHTRLVLATPLLNCYDRASTSVNANVGSATAGASVTELVGSGSAATPDQAFTLKQAPLTYVSAPTPTGRQSTLQVRANGVAWTEQPTLYGQPPGAQVFRTLNRPGGVTQSEFGDGVEGAMLPTGQSNIMASYRVGLGAAGNVGAATITTLVDRPLGVSGVVNPLAASGGQDAQSVSDIRGSAPLTVTTLGRAVSIDDYQIVAETYAGIAKASAFWIPSGRYRGVFVTVAAAGGEALPPGSPTLANLVATLQSYGNPNVAVFPQSFLETIFRIHADLAIDPAYDAGAVRAAVTQSLHATYNFDARGFGQGVSGDEIAALIQNVPGVVAVHVKRAWPAATSAAGDIGGAAFSLSAYNAWMAGALQTPLPRPRGALSTICPYLPIASADALPNPAEILVLDPDPKRLVLGSMA